MDRSLERLNVLGRNIAEVAEIWSSLQDLQHICLMHHFHTCGVDQSTALGHLGQQILQAFGTAEQMGVVVMLAPQKTAVDPTRDASIRETHSISQPRTKKIHVESGPNPQKNIHLGSRFPTILAIK